MRRMRAGKRCPGYASSPTRTSCPTRSVPTSSSETPTRTTSVERSAMEKSRLCAPTTSPDSTCFSVITPAMGARTTV